MRLTYDPLLFKSHHDVDFLKIRDLASSISSKYSILVPADHVNQVKSDYNSLDVLEADAYTRIYAYFSAYQPISKLIDDLHASTNVFVKQHSNCLYWGEMCNNLRHGRGVLLFANGKLYEGHFDNNQFHGRGLFLLANGCVFNGSFVNGKPEGQGQYRWASGETYSGEWWDGLKQGEGLWKGSKGDFYMGEWWKGYANGFGQHVWCNGDNYVGELKESLKHGFGVEDFLNGDRYSGNYLNGRPCGTGEYSWQNGAKYKGSFKNGLRYGRGEYYKHIDSLEHYSGEYLNDLKDGYGKYVWQNGTKYAGNFSEDLRSGYGEIQWNDGTSYKGQWMRGKMHGEGVMGRREKGSADADNSQVTYIKGIWKSNQFLGQGLDQNDQFDPQEFESVVDVIQQRSLEGAALGRKRNKPLKSLQPPVHSFQFLHSESEYSPKQKNNIQTKFSIQIPRLVSLESPRRYNSNKRMKLNKKSPKSMNKTLKLPKAFITQQIEKSQTQDNKPPRINKMNRVPITLPFNHFEKIPLMPKRAQSLHRKSNQIYSSIKQLSPSVQQRTEEVKMPKKKKSYWIPAGTVSVSPTSCITRIKTTKF